MGIDVKFSDLSSIEHDAVYIDDCIINQLSIDTRTLQQGDTYLAIKGDRFDGHSFVDAAVSSGAASLVVSEEVKTDVPIIKVDDTTVSLGNIAKIYRSRLPAKIIGITGSNGKTTVKGMVSSICREQGATTATVSNNNNAIGVPLTLLSASPDDEFVVVEMGTSERGEIAYLSNIVEPDVSVITNVSESHLSGIGTKQDVFVEKSAILTGTRSSGVVVINQDDDFADEAKKLAGSASVMTYGFSRDVDVGGSYRSTNTNLEVSVHSPVGDFDYELLVRGKHNVANSFAAVALCLAAGIDIPAIRAGLKSYSGTDGRLQIAQLGQNICLIDDTYNANPASSIAALDVLSEYSGRKIFVYAGMAELGEQEIMQHELVGRKATENGVDALFAYGEMVKPTAAAFEGETHVFESIDDLLEKLIAFMAPGDTVLVKGSRRFQMDRVSQRIKQELG